MTKIYIIEHLEPELFPWCLIEYKHISEIVGKDNLWFTNLSKIKNKENKNKLSSYGKIINESVQEIISNLPKSCVLDPESPNLLTPKNSEEFQYFIFGGILGDYPPRKRTKEELTKFLPHLPSFNIGKKQMSTDNAVTVVHEIVENKKDFKNLKFKDKLTIKINDVESVDLPYRYLLIDGKPNISPEIIEYLKNKEDVF